MIMNENKKLTRNRKRRRQRIAERDGRMKKLPIAIKVAKEREGPDKIKELKFELKKKHNMLTNFTN